MIFKVWKDPVWSKIIAVALLAVFSLFFTQRTITPNEVPHTSEKQSTLQNDPEIYRGVNKVFIMLFSEDSGLFGVKEAVNDCYSSITNESKLFQIKFCFSIDYAAYLFDSTISPILTFPSSTYFTEENAIKRVIKSFNKIHIGKARWKNFLYNLWIPETINVFKKASINNMGNDDVGLQTQ